MNLHRLLSVKWLLIAILCSFQITYAQNRIVSGKVTDSKDNSPIPGVSISAKGTNIGTTTGTEGNFSLSVPQTANTLVFTAVGYGTKEATITDGPISISLETTASNLNEIVVVGYGTARRRDVTGSVASVRAKDFNKGVIVSADQAIQGKVPGVQITNNSGQPGGATTVRIRGASSIRASNQPLFVVDGVPLSGTSARPGGGAAGIGDEAVTEREISSPGGNPLNFINPNDIASIEILKDASATAIYGSRGANGVVLITTKRGLSGTPTIDVSASAGVSTIIKSLDVLDAQEYKAALQKYNLTGGDFGGDVDAMDEITRGGRVQNYSAAIGGGNENGRYRFSLGYLDQQGIIEESGLKRVTAGLTSNFRFLNNRKLGLDVSIITANNTEDIAPISTNAGFAGSLIGQALQWNPTHPLRKPRDSFPAGTTMPVYGDLWVLNKIGATTINPLAMLAAHKDRASITSILTSIAPSYRFTKNLEYRLLYGINYETGVRRNHVRRWINAQGVENRGVASIFNNHQFNRSLTNTINYTGEVSSDLNLNAVVGHEYLKFESRNSGVIARDFDDFGLDYYDYIQYSTQGSRDIFSYANPTTELQSFFGRVIMNLRDKYLLTATMRADGSTRFGENNKYGYFPSVAVAWNLSREDFLQGNDMINNLKLRVGWGRTGNQEFSSGASLNRFIIEQERVRRAAFGNADLVWETSNTTNAGIDFGLLRDRIFGSIDYFYKKNTDVLYEQTVAAPGPAGKVWVNLPGYIRNTGVEVALNGALIRNTDMNWNLGVNATFLKNTVEGLTGFYETGTIHGQGVSGFRSQRITNGQPLNVFYLPRFEGIDKTTGQGIYTGGDPSINKFFVGTPNPKTLLGISTDFNYKKLTATINMNGAFGHYLLNNTTLSALSIGNLGTRNVAKSIINSDVQEATSNPLVVSTRYLEKGNYLKMANATISYNLGNMGNYFRNIVISLTGQNLFVLTDYTGFDPEVNTNKQVEGVPSLGIEYTPYPSARTILLGVNFTL